MEIGFNAGHSADVFLGNNKSLTLTSFDLGGHEYVLPAKEYIDTTYPGRHTLILGDSTVTVPKYINDNPGKVFDVIFIDGGHEYNIANTDLDNCMKLAHKDTVVILDDTMYTSGWQELYTIGPTRTWVEHVNNGTIAQIHKTDYYPGRGMSWGKYIMVNTV
jgi:predicted O-methyltransferase YrrM